MPVQNYNHCVKEMGNISSFSNEHKDGIVYSDIYLRDEPPIGLSQLGIHASKFSTAMNGIAPKFDVVYTGYGNYKVACQNTSAYGDCENVVLFCDFDEEKSFINNVWLTLYVSSESQKISALNILNSISSIGEFVLVDWNQEFISKLDNKPRLEKHLDEIIEWRVNVMRCLKTKFTTN